MSDKPQSAVAVQLPDMEQATELATELTFILNQHDIATGLTAIGMVLAQAVLAFGEDQTFDALRQHARAVAAATMRNRAMAENQCEGSA